MLYNEFLAGSADAKGGGRFIEEPGKIENFVFQTRGGALEPFEEAMALALTTAFDGGAFELPELVSALNEGGSVDRAGSAWTEGSLEAELDRLGEALFQHVPGDMAV